MDFTAAWGWPQWVIAGFMLTNLILGTALHGKAKTGNWNGFATMVSFGLTAFILSCGGFFS